MAFSEYMNFNYYYILGCFAPEMNIDLPGSGNIHTDSISAESDYECFQKCKQNSDCEMFTWVSPNFEGLQCFL